MNTVIPITWAEAQAVLQKAGYALPETRPAEPARQGGWPILDEAALYGLAGDVVRTVAPHTESDPALLLVTFLAMFGSAVGRGPHMVADAAMHPARLYVVGVGETSRSRKGTSMHNIRPTLTEADPGFEERIFGGLGSGEALIAAVSDGDRPDGRALVYEPEFARVLQVAKRDGSTLSAIIRDAWDRSDLRVMTRKEPLHATGAHVSIVSHITVEELRRHLTATEIANGFANRFLFLAARRSKLLPSGGDLGSEDFARLGRFARISLQEARRVHRMHRTPEAEDRWAEVYLQMAEDDGAGLYGAVTARAEAQALRLSVAYALTDGSPVIDLPHLEAAWAVWQYSAASVRYIFGGVTGDELADRLLAGIRNAGATGLDGTQQRALFSGHVSGADLEGARQRLEERGLVTNTRTDTGGRPRVVTRLLNGAESALGAERGSEPDA